MAYAAAHCQKLVATQPALVARKDVWANRTAKNIVSEALTAISVGRAVHVEHSNGSDAGRYAYSAVYDWLLWCTNELTQIDDHPRAPTAEEEVVAAKVANLSVVAPVPHVSTAVPPAHLKRPYVDEIVLDECAARVAAMDVETRRQTAELAALAQLFDGNAAACLVEEHRRLFRCKVLLRAQYKVVDLPPLCVPNLSTTSPRLCPLCLTAILFIILPFTDWCLCSTSLSPACTRSRTKVAFTSRFRFSCSRNSPSPHLNSTGKIYRHHPAYNVWLVHQGSASY